MLIEQQLRLSHLPQPPGGSTLVAVICIVTPDNMSAAAEHRRPLHKASVPEIHNMQQLHPPTERASRAIAATAAAAAPCCHLHLCCCCCLHQQQQQQQGQGQGQTSQKTAKQ